MTMGAQYRLVRHDGASWTVAEGGELSLGRFRGNDVPIADTSASRRHATLLVARGRCWIRDEASTHGTYVNGRPVAGQQELRPGDTLQIGSTTFRLNLDAAAAVSGARLEARRRQPLILWGVVSAVLIVVIVAIAIGAGGGGGGNGDAPPAAQSGQAKVDITQPLTSDSGGTVDLGGGGAIHFSPGALSEDGQVQVRSLSPAESANTLGGQKALSAVYDITVGPAIVEGQIDLQLPYEDAGLSAEEENSLSIFTELEGERTALASLVDTEENIVYAHTTHLTPFWVWLNPFDSPGITRVWPEPTELASVQPSKPVSDLTVSAEVEDEDLKGVWVRYSFCTQATTFGATAKQFIEFAEKIQDVELILEGGPYAPPVRTNFVPESEKRGKGRCYPVTRWVPMGETAPGVYQSTFLLSRIANWGDQDVLKMELAEIKVEFLARDEQDQQAEDSLTVPVLHGPVASDLLWADPGRGDTVYSPRPSFAWTFERSADVGAVRFYLAKGGILWPDQGRPRYSVEALGLGSWEPGVLLPDDVNDLEAGLYCWGLEVSRDNDYFGETDDIRTEPYCFYVGEGEEPTDTPEPTPIPTRTPTPTKEPTATSTPRPASVTPGPLQLNYAPVLERSAEVKDAVPIGIDWSPADSSLVIISTYDGEEELSSVELWDIRNGRRTRALMSGAPGVFNVGFRPDGSQVVVWPFLGTEYYSREVRLFDTATGRRTQTLGSALLPFDLDFSPDGELLAIASIGEDEESYALELWDPDSGSQVSTLPISRVPLQVAFGPGGDRLAVVTADEIWGESTMEIEIWDLSTRRVVERLDTDAAAHTLRTSLFWASPEDTLVLVGEMIDSGTWLVNVDVWVTDQGDTSKHTHDRYVRLPSGTDFDEAWLPADLSPNGHFLALNNLGEVSGLTMYMDITGNQSLSSWRTHEPHLGMAFSPDSSRLAITKPSVPIEELDDGNWSGVIQVWEMAE